MNYAIILAGGFGVRFGDGAVPKQFVELTGRPMVAYSMQTAQMNKHIDAVCVVAPAESHEQVRTWARVYGIDKLKYLALPGRERHRSVYSGLSALEAERNDTVMIMTSVCPFLSQKTVDKHYELIGSYDGVITVVKATDAVTVSIDGNSANRTLQKKYLFIQQGPQTYRYNVLLDAHNLYLAEEERTEVYEDSELVLQIGGTIGMVTGDRFCIKVTYPEDLAMAESLHPLFEEQEKRG
jgi:2-C-methyl-D-erythritol 4-phosphate cytidylyltransferase